MVIIAIIHISSTGVKPSGNVRHQYETIDDTRYYMTKECRLNNTPTIIVIYI